MGISRQIWVNSRIGPVPAGSESAIGQKQGLPRPDPPSLPRPVKAPAAKNSDVVWNRIFVGPPPARVWLDRIHLARSPHPQASRAPVPPDPGRSQSGTANQLER